MKKDWKKRARLNDRQRKLLRVIAGHVANTMRSPLRVQRTASDLERRGFIQWRTDGWELTPQGYQQFLLLNLR